MTARCRRREAGLSLIELMVALAIGVFLLAGALTVFAKTRDLYRTNEAAARLQETARFAMSTIEADVRMANYWGLNSRADLIDNARAPGAGYPTGLDAGFEGDIDACGDNWPVDLTNYVDGTNNSYALACDPKGTAKPNADQLTIRRVSVDAIDPDDVGDTAGLMKLQTSRLQGTIFADDELPSGYLPPLSETRALVVDGYYVDEDSDSRAGTPSLRRKRLDRTGTEPAIVDQEITSGVEDLQFQVGYDTDGDQNVNFYVNPGTGGIPAGAPPVAVRIWLLVRAEQPEVGFVDDRTYVYADRSVTPNDGFRRLLISKTIHLRNTRR